MAVAATTQHARQPTSAAKASASRAVKLRRRLAVALAAGVGAMVVAGAIALLAGPSGVITHGHGVSKSRAYVPVARVRTAVTCPGTSTLTRAWDTAHVGAATDVAGVSCAGGWAVAEVDTAGYTTPGLFFFQDHSWQWTDRVTPCSTHQVPASLEQEACESG